MAQETQDKQKITLRNVVDFLHTATGVIRSGFSANVSTGPYLSNITVQPVIQRPAFPWTTVLLVGGAIVALLVLKD